MKRSPSPKQRFIKDYARLIYGPEAKSNALTHKDRTIIKNLFTVYPASHELLAGYPAWLKDNWPAIRSHLDNPEFEGDISTPGTYLFSSSFMSQFMAHLRRGSRLKPR
jgi:hypothetical protein